MQKHARFEGTGSEQLEVVYLDLLKTALLGTLYSDSEEYQRVQMRRGSWQAWAFAPLTWILGLKSYSLYKRVLVTTEQVMNGLYWPANGLTMIGRKRLENVQSCLESVIADDIEGDVIETGVWRGGTCILMKALLNLRRSQKRLFVADSFRGVPKPDAEKYPADAAEERKEAFYLFDQLAVSLTQVQDNFRRFGVLDDRVYFLEGWFKDTLTTDAITKLALMRLDGDLYESTWDALTNLYPKLQRGGYCIIDDYGGIPACKQAVDDYRRQLGIYEAIIPIDTTGIYWRRQSSHNLLDEMASQRS